MDPEGPQSDAIQTQIVWSLPLSPTSYAGNNNNKRMKTKKNWNVKTTNPGKHLPRIPSWYPYTAKVFHARFTPARPKIESSTPILYRRHGERQGKWKHRELTGGVAALGRRIKHQSAMFCATRSASSRLFSYRAVSPLFRCPPPAPFVVAISLPLLVLVARFVAFSGSSPSRSCARRP